MTDLVDPQDIERIVGIERHQSEHLARAVSAEQKVYILHAARCVESGIDLRECAYSKALDSGIDIELWEHWQDQPIVVGVLDGELIPVDVPDMPSEVRES